MSAGGAIRRLAELVDAAAGSGAEKPPASPKMGRPVSMPASVGPGVDPGASVEEVKENTDKIRASMQKMGAGLGAVAVGVLGTVGYTRADDIFPFPTAAPGWLGPLTATLAAAALLSSALLVARFYFAQRRVLIGSDLSGIPWSAPRERKRLSLGAARAAAGLDAPSLHQVDLRATRLARIAHRLDPDGEAPNATLPPSPSDDQRLASRAREEAQYLQGKVRLALYQLASSLIEQRSRAALGGPLSLILILVTVTGVGFTFAVGDWARASRDSPSARVEQAMTCLHAIPTHLTAAQKKALRGACVNAAIGK